MKYSPELIKKCIEYFKKEHSVVFTETEAMESLDNLGGLYLAFHDAKDVNNVNKTKNHPQKGGFC